MSDERETTQLKEISLESLIALLRRLANEDKINPVLATEALSGETRVYMLSLDSVDMTVLYLAVDEEYGVVLSDDAISDIDTLSELVEKLRIRRIA
ncbi:hypothetical protein CCP2SC5_330010 [Azospirillaceae bacterium]